MKTLFIRQAAFLIGIALSSGCTKHDGAIEEMKFDPSYIASEADRGNLAPLTELNAACSAETEKNGKRLSACMAQDEVRKLSKPISIRF